MIGRVVTIILAEDPSGLAPDQAVHLPFKQESRRLVRVLNDPRNFVVRSVEIAFAQRRLVRGTVVIQLGKGADLP